MLSLVLFLLAACAVWAAPILTAFPNATVQMRSGSSFSFFCAATGLSPTVVSVQTNLCGSQYSCAATGLGSASYTLVSSDIDNCLLVRCLASDSSGVTFSAPVAVVIAFDASSNVNGSCSAVCNTVFVNLTGSGPVNLNGFVLPYSMMNITIYTYDFNFTGNAFSPLNIDNFVLQKSANVSYDGTGSATLNFGGNRVTASSFSAAANQLTVTRARLNITNDIYLCGNTLNISQTTLIAGGNITQCS